MPEAFQRAVQHLLLCKTVEAQSSLNPSAPQAAHPRANKWDGREGQAKEEVEGSGSHDMKQLTFTGGSLCISTSQTQVHKTDPPNSIHTFHRRHSGYLKELCVPHTAWTICNCNSNILFNANTQIKGRNDVVHSSL